MSLKHFAIIAPLSYPLNYNRNKTTFTTPPTATSIASTPTALPSTIFWTQQQQQQATAPGRQQPPNVPQFSPIDQNDDAAISTDRNGNHNDKDDSNNQSNNGESNVTIANAIITYYGGSGGLPSTRLSGGGGGHNSVGSATGSGGGQTYPNAINGNVNLLLGGAMLSLVTTVLCIVCYCCHRSIKKRTEAAYRQQRQWLENDPNMEIYSVEQCYETSGLFLGESTDGLATLTTLHHEPPPSYDAVVAMQEQQILQQQIFQQQQQQQLMQLQHSSPPPGYRSRLDVRDTTTATTTAVTAAADVATTTAAALIRDRADSNGNLSGSSCNNFPLFDKQVAAQSRNLGSSALLNMKKVLSAQSCCSLQRAEVENMWNAAAAAVAARAAHPGPALNDSDSGSHFGVSLRGRQPTPPLMLARKSLPLSLPSKLATVNAAGRRYQRSPHTGHYYRRGCPLCGKFRYDADTLAMSCESGLDSPPILDASNNNNNNNNNNADSHACSNTELCQQSAEYERRLQSANASTAAAAPIVAYDIDFEEDGCACSVTMTAPSLQRQHCATAVVSSDNDNRLHAGAREQSPQQNDNQFQRQPAASATDAYDNINNNNNNNMPTTSLANSEADGVTDAATAAATPDGAIPNAAALDTINANAGIIRVDMSKIIDPSGLPTYEAALKLESSGYV